MGKRTEEAINLRIIERCLRNIFSWNPEEKRSELKIFTG